MPPIYTFGVVQKMKKYLYEGIVGENADGHMTYIA